MQPERKELRKWHFTPKWPCYKGCHDFYFDCFSFLLLLSPLLLPWARLGPPQALLPRAEQAGSAGVGRKPFSGCWLPQLLPEGRPQGCVVPTLGLLGWWGAIIMLGEEGGKTFMTLAGDCAFQAFVLGPKSFLCSLDHLRRWGLNVTRRGKGLPWPVLPAAPVVINCLSVTRVLPLWMTVYQPKCAWKCQRQRQEKEVWKYTSPPRFTVKRQIGYWWRHLSFIQPSCSSGK